MHPDSDAARNRAHWDAKSDKYQREHASQLNEKPCAWGVWALPEAELNILGDVAGKDVLEFGCGAAQWSIFLAKRGARPVGLDNSARQLEHARRLMGEAGVEFPLVHSPAEQTPLPDASFDIVFCDHGAMSFTDPGQSVPEAARLLRPGGLFAFNTMSTLMHLCLGRLEHVTTSLQLSYFQDLGRFEYEGEISYHLAYGDWIRLFRRSGFQVEDLIELRPPQDAVTTYGDYVSPDWARRWPAENIWKLRRP
jgi:SAM-dependent methyltransferase